MNRSYRPEAVVPPLLLAISRNTQNLLDSPPVLDTLQTVGSGGHRLAILVKGFTPHNYLKALRPAHNRFKEETYATS